LVEVKNLQKNLIGQLRKLQKFGGTANDVQSIMEEFADNSGRARIISPEEVSNIFIN
jgi:hypothetical protein